MLKLIRESMVREYDDKDSSHITVKCSNCETYICDFNAMFKSEGKWYVNVFAMVEDKWNNNQILCFNCNEVIGEFMGEQIVKLIKNKFFFWYYK